MTDERPRRRLDSVATVAIAIAVKLALLTLLTVAILRWKGLI